VNSAARFLTRKSHARRHACANAGVEGGRGVTYRYIIATVVTWRYWAVIFDICCCKIFCYLLIVVPLLVTRVVDSMLYSAARYPRRRSALRAARRCRTAYFTHGTSKASIKRGASHGGCAGINYLFAWRGRHLARGDSGRRARTQNAKQSANSNSNNVMRLKSKDDRRATGRRAGKLAKRL